MVKSYCVKQRKQTKCVERSGYKTAKKKEKKRERGEGKEEKRKEQWLRT